MEFTGERYVPSINGEIKYEHLHRYALCMDFVDGKSVLDIASGEGYGSALLAKTAKSVIGVDISPESIQYATEQYRDHKNLDFLVGSCDSIPLTEKSIDIVVSFETIEHHDQHEEMMLEIKRVLKQNGTLVISSPNRLTYSDEANYSNPYHVKELYYDEFATLLSRHFSFVKIYGQRMASGSFIFPLGKSSESIIKSYTGDADNLAQQVCSLESPIYYVAVCSDNEANVTSKFDSLYIEPDDDLLKVLQDSSQRVYAQLKITESQLLNTQFELQNSQSQLQLTQSELQNSQSQSELQNSQSQLQLTQSELQNSQSQLQLTQSELQNSQSQLIVTQRYFEDAINEIRSMEMTKFWKFRKIWFKFKRLISLSSQTIETESVSALLQKVEKKIKKEVRSELKKPESTYLQLSNLESPKPISLNTSTEPIVSIVIPVFNQSKYTFNCLNSLQSIDTAYEVIVVDDASTDDTQSMLVDVFGIKIITNTNNIGFIRSCNRGVTEAKGKFICFLNNDTKVLPNWLESLLEVAENDPDVGAVGSKLIYPDGRLQEAGGIIWKDGSAGNFGNSDDPYKPEYNYLREVDYCSGASLLVRAKLFRSIGGFSEEFLPSYYEDADLCFTIRSEGYKVIYQPKSQLIHFEGITSGSDINVGIKRYQQTNSIKFGIKWRETLKKHLPDNGNIRDDARRLCLKPTILIVDSYVPLYDRESGSCRIYNIIKILKKLGYSIVFLPDNGQCLEPYVSELQSMGVEVLYSTNDMPEIKSHLLEILSMIDIAWVCRPELCEKYLGLLMQNSKIRLIYDTVDLHFLRLKREKELLGGSINQQVSWQSIQSKELSLAKSVHSTIVVTDVEKDILLSLGVSNVQVIPNIHEVYAGLLPEFDQRKGLLFIGGYNHTPNVDAVIWLCKNIMPLVWEQFPEIQLTLLGSNPPSLVSDLQSDRVVVAGYVRDVEPYFLNQRVFVAPLRYGAGMKGKVGQSLSYGLPVVTTSIGAEGFGLRDGMEAIIADKPEDFANGIITLYNNLDTWKVISQSALQSVEPYRPENVERKLKVLINNMLLGSQD
ncbi:MAG: glycosyltransferase [Microcystis aeruginosa G11-01]|nr:glycosyltransferase [Microcystis aeruginosa G11-01]